MRTNTHHLKHPIIADKKDGDDVIEEELKPAGHPVILKRPKAKDMRAFDKHGDEHIAGMIELVKRCSNLSDIEVENLDSEDFEAVGNVLSPSPLSGRSTGGSD
ncbi:phage tail assembly protein [Citromicrobium bathyomarinum]|uniref:phage tail assembly protein n=1 Tax=Citromicrobium bathyomarinum TaxID=72174 RepID=UPI00315A912E